MYKAPLEASAGEIMQQLCVKIANRSLGSAGNRQASTYFDDWMVARGFALERQVFDCQDWEGAGAHLTVAGQPFSVFPSPHSTGCRVSASLVAASTLEQLTAAPAQNTLLLLHGPIASSQIFPSNYPFYYPDEHRAIYEALEASAPAAVLTATVFSPKIAGALYPVAMIEDGNFNIPSVYLTEEEGARLALLAGKQAELVSKARRIPSHGWNSVARLNPEAAHSLVFCAHIDARPTTPGALDNASGVTVLMLLAELLAHESLQIGIEIVSMNGEDHFSAKGELVYLDSVLPRIARIPVVVNLDGLGCQGCSTAFSLYECQEGLAAQIRSSLSARPGLVEGDPWHQGDHSMFIQQGLPAVALTSLDLQNLLAQIIHTPADNPEVVDPAQLAETTRGLRDLALRLDGLFQSR